MSDKAARPAVVIDDGRHMCRAGLAEDDSPRAVFPPIVGQPRTKSTRVGADQIDCYVGDEAFRRREILTLRSPAASRDSTNWADKEKVWHHLFYNELRLNPEDQPVLLTEPLLNPKDNRENMTKIMFETFNVPGLYVSNSAVLASYAAGLTTAVVLDAGLDVTNVVSIFEGYVMPHTVENSHVAGNQLTSYLTKLLADCGYSFTTTGEKEIVRDIKEKLCYVAPDFEQEILACTRSSVKRTYVLPDGKEIKFGKETFRCPETLFNPSITGTDSTSAGIHTLIHRSIMKTDPDIKKPKDLYSAVVLSGGSSMFPGIEDRLAKELRALAEPGTKINILGGDPGGRTCSAWIGGSVLASLSSFRENWVTKHEYEEMGPGILHRKCL